MSDINKLTGRQISAARALAGVSQSDLAAWSKVSVPTVRRMEACVGEVVGMANNIDAVRRALEDVGVLFIAENGEGPGVRLKKDMPPTQP